MAHAQNMHAAGALAFLNGCFEQLGESSLEVLPSSIHQLWSCFWALPPDSLHFDSLSVFYPSIVLSLIFQEQKGGFAEDPSPTLVLASEQLAQWRFRLGFPDYFCIASFS